MKSPLKEVSPKSASSFNASLYVVHPSSGFTGKYFCRMELEHLKRLRQANQDLLQRLRMKQEEIRKRLPRTPLCPASLHNSTAPERSVHLPQRGVRVVSVLEVLGSNWALYDRLFLWSDVVKEMCKHAGAGRKWNMGSVRKITKITLFIVWSPIPFFLQRVQFLPKKCRFLYLRQERTLWNIILFFLLSTKAESLVAPQIGKSCV